MKPYRIGGEAIKPASILVIEQDKQVGAMVTKALEEAGYTVVRASDTLDGLRKLYEAYPDLIIMAKELPPVRGEEPFLRVRQASYLPLIVMGKDEETSEMLDFGADVYMMKPPDSRELVARVRSLLRRKRRNGPQGDNPGPKLNNSPQNGENDLLNLTPTETRLASCLLANKGKIIDYERLIDEVWGSKRISVDTLHFYMRRLRDKMPELRISVLRGIGYCYSETTPSAN